MSAVLCALTRKVIDAGNEVWTELLKEMPVAADAGNDGGLPSGIAAVAANNMHTQTVITSDDGRLICLFRCACFDQFGPRYDSLRYYFKETIKKS